MLARDLLPHVSSQLLYSRGVKFCNLSGVTVSCDINVMPLMNETLLFLHTVTFMVCRQT